MKRPSLLKFLLLVCVAPLAFAEVGTKPGSAGRPNILFIIADQWRPQAFHFSGDPNVHTPNLDALHAESLDCVNAVSTVPVCSPTRASLLTGQHALTHGVFLNDVPLDPKAVTISKVLAREGYDTGYIGKWHINGDGRSAFIPRERRQGFDYWKVLECTHNYNHSFYYADGPEKLLWQGFDAIAQTDDAAAYLRNHAKSEKPFLLVLAWGPPHDPYELAPAKYRAMYPPADIKLRANVPPTIGGIVRVKQSGYYANCTSLDDCIGTLMTTLRETGLADNTLVILTADHGDLMGSHGQFNKQQPYDESVRVPLLMHWPAGFGTAAKSLDAPVVSADFMPTILGLCHVPIPTTVEGIDYSGYLHGGKDPSDGIALISCVAPFGQWDRDQGGREYRGLRTDRYTYVRDLKGPWLLFDNQTDPYQMDNLVDKPDSAALKSRMDALLAQKLKREGDEFLPGDAYIAKWGYVVNAKGTVPYDP